MPALKQVVLKGRADKLRAQLNPLMEKREDIKTRRAALAVREAELERAIGEVTDETPDEDKTILEEQVEECLESVEAIQQEETENEQAITGLQQQITQIETELAQVEEQVAAAVQQDPQPEQQMDQNTARTAARPKEETRMHKTFYGMTYEQRDALFRRDDVKRFVQGVRDLRTQKRGVSGAEVTVPTVVLNIVNENMEYASKLYKHVNHQRVPGKARQAIMGVTPEAVWTEMCAKITELDLSFAMVEVDGYKVAGYIPACNALLEDADDVALGQAIITALINAIGIALDKAILYGTGVKMPVGIVTRLTQTEDPGDGGAYGREWQNLSATNVKSIASGTTGLELYQQIMLNAGAAHNNYARGAKFWAMSESTRLTIMASMLSITANGAVASAVNNELPLIGGVIETLEFIPDGVIVGGYGEMYLLAERADITVAQSEHVRFIEDQTVFRATARYDGVPVIAESFVAMHIAGGTVSADAVTFEPDLANNAG